MQQGDPFGTLGFCLATHKLVSSLSSELNVWYLDDGLIFGNPLQVLKDFETILEYQDRLGLNINVSKCELLQMSGNSSVDNIFRGVKVIKFVDTFLLGKAITHESVIPVLLSKCLHLNKMKDRLSLLDANDDPYILKNCLSTPKILYSLRTTPCFDNPVLQDFDKIRRDSLAIILNCDVNGSSLRQAYLSVSHGGLGIRSAAQLSLPAFLSSAIDSSEMMSSLLTLDQGINDPEVETAIQGWRQCCASDSIPNEELRIYQKSRDIPTCDKTLRSLIENANSPSEKSTLLAVYTPRSSEWRKAISMQTLGLKLNN